MADPKFKFILTDGTNTKTVYENHPKLDATNVDFAAAGTALDNVYGLELDEVLINSDTSVYKAE